MKKLIFTLLLTVAATNVIAETLLSCNPPNGGGFQEIKITRSAGKIYRQELNFAGAMSGPKEISALSWAKKDLRWVDPSVGNVHLRLVKIDGQLFWAFNSKGLGVESIGYCEQ